MKLYIDLTECNDKQASLCNYDGMCMFHSGDYTPCYGERFGTDECPLKDRFAAIEIKDEYLSDYPFTKIIDD